MSVRNVAGSLLCILSVAAVGSADDLRVLPEKEGPKQVLAHLKQEAAAAFARRQAEYAAARSPEQIALYQQRRQEFFRQQLGETPKPQKIAARTVCKLAGDGFAVEKVLFTSRPGHEVSALLFLPQSPRWQAPYPGVLVPCGHSPQGKANAGYQRLCMLLARHGMAALCYDPIGQGERYQFLEKDGEPQFKSTSEHSILGVPSILVGRNTATYRLWDGMRAIDYLSARPEIDAERIGCTGSSGGGTLTEYLMALDPRIRCAAPASCVTTFARRLETIGPGDAEQNICGQIGFGLDHADYTLMRAPRPTLLCCGTLDFVDIAGSWDIFRETKRLYTRLGFAERIDLVEVDAKHGFVQGLREATVHWMQRWLRDVDAPVREKELPVFSVDEVLCTPRGQVALLPEAVTVQELNRQRAEELAKQRQSLWTTDPEKALAEVRRLAGVRPLSDLRPPTVENVGSIERRGYRIDKLTFEATPGLTLPALLFTPSQPPKGKTLYLDGKGMAGAAVAGGPIEKLVESGQIVLALDLRGQGEMGSATGQWGGSYDAIMLAYLLGKPQVGSQAEEILTAARYLQQEKPGDQEKLHLVAVGAAVPAALHAAALENQLFATTAFRDGLLTWEGLFKDPAAAGYLASTVHHALSVYDLSDLHRLLQ